MIKEHYDAVRALLPGTIRTYMWKAEERDAAGKILLPRYPYVMLGGDLGNETSGGPDGESLTDVPNVLTLRIRATYVGINADSMLIIARNARKSLNRKTPVVEGWRTNPLRQSVLLDGQVDRDVVLTGGGNPTFAVDEFLLVSHKL
ncbi:hypothetical protein HWD94_04005 [Pseudarthrobacter equi]|uniref:hypothetical protein n=1 Tax=Pseudarthrobacter equi TaxID=728066 RepID=UPI0021C01FA9|nr:hypothetical protein [Pseudarthrobacter equi]MCT9624287.1 hypothetical protein [Pseudarthrobacter equi]